MLIFEIVMVAMGAVRANLLRSVLTTLGIVIGIAAVITMVALGEGAQRQVQEEINRMGTNVLTIRPGQQRAGGVSRGDTEMSIDDAIALRAETGNFMKISPEQSSGLQISYMRWNSRSQIEGVWPEYFDIYNLELAAGRLFTQSEVQGRRRVAVLGSAVMPGLDDETFTDLPPELILGEKIQIRGLAFEIIGVLKEKGDAGFLRPDNSVFIPQSTAQYRVMGSRNRLNTIYAATESPSQMEMAYAEIDRVLRREHRIRAGDEADFQISNATDLLQTFNETRQTFTMLLAGIAGISLLVGGIGIMNIMLVSVTERTREIGVRKALGASRKAIMTQFLVEALFLCVLGGLLGVGAGYGAAALIRHTAGWQAAVAPSAVITALVFSAGVGLFFGMWPARRAAILDPIDALRYE
jgi:putative ABC transport system permease protein